MLLFAIHLLCLFREGNAAVQTFKHTVKHLPNKPYGMLCTN